MKLIDHIRSWLFRLLMKLAKNRYRAGLRQTNRRAEKQKKVPDDSLPFAIMLIVFGLLLWGGAAVLLTLVWIRAPAYAVLPSIYEAANLAALIVFGWMAADPRGSWSTSWQMKWQRERHEGNTPLYVASLLFCWCGFWSWFGIAMARISIQSRDNLSDQLNHEDARWLKQFNGNHA